MNCQLKKHLYPTKLRRTEHRTSLSEIQKVSSLALTLREPGLPSLRHALYPVTFAPSVHCRETVFFDAFPKRVLYPLLVPSPLSPLHHLLRDVFLSSIRLAKSSFRKVLWKTQTNFLANPIVSQSERVLLISAWGPVRTTVHIQVCIFHLPQTQFYS